MSISTLTTLAAVRDDRAPRRADVGKTKPEDPHADERASIANLLVTAVPTELVAPYTALTAVIVGLIDAPTPAAPDPGQFEALRWIVFALLLVGTGGAIYRGAAKKRGPGSGSRLPAAELAAGLVAAAGWGLALPESPLIPYFDEDGRVIAPLVAGFAAVAILVAVGSKLKERAT
jgi:hypothetical protein